MTRHNKLTTITNYGYINYKHLSVDHPARRLSARLRLQMRRFSHGSAHLKTPRASATQLAIVYRCYSRLSLSCATAGPAFAIDRFGSPPCIFSIINIKRSGSTSTQLAAHQRLIASVCSVCLQNKKTRSHVSRECASTRRRAISYTHCSASARAHERDHDDGDQQQQQPSPSPSPSPTKAPATSAAPIIRPPAVDAHGRLTSELLLDRYADSHNAQQNTARRHTRADFVPPHRIDRHK